MTILLLLLAVTSLTEGARILAVIPLPIPSHHFVYRPVLEELGRRGHQVLYVTSFLYQGSPPQGIEQLDISDSLVLRDDNITDVDPKEFGDTSIPRIISMMYEFGVKDGMVFLSNPKVQQLIHSDQKFDAVIFESYFVQEYLSAFIHKFNAIGIEMMPLGDDSWVNELAGLPDNPSYQLDWKTELSNDMDFWQRLYSTYVTVTSTVLRYYYLHTDIQHVMDHCFNYTGWESRPSIDVLTKNRSLILSNAHPFVGYPFPTAPHYKPIGGINIKPNKPLPKEMEEFMNKSKHGVIYMSFGSNVNLSMPSYAEVFNSLLGAFKEVPQSVLMKYETDYDGELPHNVRLYKWMPQQDILNHKNVVLFITHGGLLSMNEAINFGVPLIGVPFYGDQAKNMIFAETEGFGRMLKYENITKENILWNIREILSNKRYKEEVDRRSKLFRDTRHSPVEEAAYWIEHSLKYPNALTPKAASLSFVQLHMLDVIGFIAAVVSVVMFAICRITYCIVRATHKKKKSPEKLKKH